MSAGLGALIGAGPRGSGLLVPPGHEDQAPPKVAVIELTFKIQFADGQAGVFQAPPSIIENYTPAQLAAHIRQEAEKFVGSASHLCEQRGEGETPKKAESGDYA